MMKLGCKVTAPGRVVRSTEGLECFWYRPSWMNKPVTGIYAGNRNYQSGVLDWIDEEGCHFTQTRPTLRVGLIVTDARRNPTPVVFSEMEEVL